MNNKQEWEKYQLKQKAMKYYQKNKVPEKMEYVLNHMFHEDPVDVFGYLANYFETYALPVTIYKLQAYLAWDSKGEPTLGVDIHCMIKNKKKLVSSMISAGYDSETWDQFKIKELLEEKEKKLVSVKAAIGYLNGRLGEQFHGTEILNSQQKTDAIIKDFFDALQLAAEEEEKKKQEALAEAGTDAASTNITETGPTEVSGGTETERGSASKRSPGKKSAKAAKAKVDITLPPNDPPNERIPGSPAGSALSQAMCTAEATVRDVPLFEHIACLANENNQVPISYKLPFLMVTMLHCGKLSSGKVNAFKEILLIPSFQFSIKECVSHLLSIHDCMISVLLDTYPKQMYSINKVSEIGTITVQFDKPELVLDLIIEAIETADFTPGEDFSIAINCASHEFVDLDKGRYEFVTGMNMKNLEDVIEFWVDLVKSYPAIVALIDPVRKKEGQLYLQLCELISSHCLILDDSNVSLPKKCVSDCKEIKGEGTSSPLSDNTLQPTEEKSTEQMNISVSSGQILKMQQSTTVTDLINSVASLHEAGTYAILSLCQGEGRETFIVDLAVGLKCQFLKTGGLSRGERFQILNRLIYIEQILTESGQLERDTVHWTFPKLVIEKASDSLETMEENTDI